LENLDNDSEIEEAWAVEVERRIREVESGTVPTIPLAEALAQARAALVRGRRLGNSFWQGRL